MLTGSTVGVVCRHVDVVVCISTQRHLGLWQRVELMRLAGTNVVTSRSNYPRRTTVTRLGE